MIKIAFKHFVNSEYSTFIRTLIISLQRVGRNGLACPILDY